MKKLTLLAIMAVLMSCNDTKQPNSEKIKGNTQEPIVAFSSLTKDYNTWWTYHSREINLTLNFRPFDEASKEITKDKFLKKLTSGNYIPIELKTKDSITAYKLFELDKNKNRGIVPSIKNTSAVFYEYFKMEGLDFPSFNVTNLEGNILNNESLRGKTTILKSWFIACKPCVAEFPELNELVEHYKNKKDVQFLSLALDESSALEKFLINNPFNYQIIAEQENLIEKKLKLRAYPTHLIVNQQGKIVKVFTKASQLMSFLKFETSETKDNTSDLESPPPPPPPLS